MSRGYKKKTKEQSKYIFANVSTDTLKISALLCCNLARTKQTAENRAAMLKAKYAVVGDPKHMLLSRPVEPIVNNDNKDPVKDETCSDNSSSDKSADELSGIREYETSSSDSSDSSSSSERSNSADDLSKTDAEWGLRKQGRELRTSLFIR